ncbi:MAG TPA: hypothetical protein VJ440_03690 [Candidatus Brocadiaceae bacterium]|nr:hypothetical protein [Candidatus Brocadiaceae bacterium]
MSKIIINSGYTEELKTLVIGALENEVKLITIGLKKTRKNLSCYEDKFKMDSETFYKKYSFGEMGDNMEYIEWAGEIETLKKLERNFKDLSEAEVC